MEEYPEIGKDDGEELTQLVCFRLADERCALDIACVREVIRAQRIISVPQMPECALGVVNVRGNILAVFDFRRKFGLKEKAFDEKTKLIVIDAPASPAGPVKGKALYGAGGDDAPVCFVADEIVDNVSIERSSIAPAPYAPLKIPREYMAGIARVDERTIVILDLKKIHESILEDIRRIRAKNQ